MRRGLLLLPFFVAGCVVNAPADVSCEDDADCAGGLVCVERACVVVVVVGGEGEGEEGEGEEGEGEEGEGEEGEGEGEVVDVGTKLTQLQAAPAVTMANATTTLTLTQVTAAPTTLTSPSFTMVVDGVDLGE